MGGALVKPTTLLAFVAAANICVNWPAESAYGKMAASLIWPWKIRFAPTGSTPMLTPPANDCTALATLLVALWTLLVLNTYRIALVGVVVKATSDQTLAGTTRPEL